MKWKHALSSLTITVTCVNGAMEGGLEPRQAESSASSISQTSSSKPSAATTSFNSAAAAATPSGTSPRTSSDVSATAHSSTSDSSSSEASAAPQFITVFASRPPFTATTSSAHQAQGVNATFNSTFTHPSTVSTGTATNLPPGAILDGPGAEPTGAQIGDIPDDFIACRINGSDHKQGPFCTPEYNQNLWVNNVYAVTWNPDLFPLNATNYVEIHNTNSTSSDPSQSLILNSTLVPNPMGYLNIYMNHSFLGPHSGNYTADGMNMSFILYSTPLGGTANRTLGPNTTLVINPADLPRIKIKNPIPTKKGLEIGLPIGLVALVVIALSIWCGMRKHRRHWSEMRHYGQDYMRKRMKGRGKGEGSIELSDYDFDSNTRTERFADEPTRGRGDRNEFREELERQRKEEWQNKAAKVSSF